MGIKSMFSSVLSALTNTNGQVSDIPISSDMGMNATREFSMSGHQVAPKNWSITNAILEGFSASDVVYSCCRVWGDSLAQVPLIVEEFDEKEKHWAYNPVHPLNDILQRPNPYIGSSELLETGSHHINLGGNLLTWVNRTLSGEPGELWALNPSEIFVLPDAKGYIKGYEYRPNGGMTPPIFLSPNSVIHVRLVDPANPWWGMAPLKAASMTADTDRAAIQWNYEAMKNRAVPDFLVSPDENMTMEQHEQFVTAMRRSLQGAMNARNPMVLSGKAAVHKLGFNSAEMDFLDTRRFNRESICAVFRTPVPLIIFDQQGGSLSNNVSPVYRFFWEQNMVPMVNKILESYNQVLIPYYDKTKGKKLRIVADYEQIPAMATTLLDKAKTALVLSQIGIPFKHINKRLKMGFPLDMEMEQINVNRGTAIDRTHLDEDNTPSGTTNGSSGSLPQAATRGKKDGQR